MEPKWALELPRCTDFCWCDDPFCSKRVEDLTRSSQNGLEVWRGALARRPERRRGGGGGNLLPSTRGLARPTKGSADFMFFFGASFCIDLLRSALARRPAYTLRMYTLLRMLAPCLASALSRYHPGWDPTPRIPPTPQGPPPPHSPPQGPPTTTPPHPTSPHPTPPPVSPSGRLFQVYGYSKWMVIPRAWLCPKGVKIRLEQTRTCSDSFNAESIDCFGGSLHLLSSNNAALLVRITRSSHEQPQEYQDHHQEAHEHPGAPQEHPGAHQEHPRALRSTREHPVALEPV